MAKTIGVSRHCLNCTFLTTGEVEKVVKELGIQMNPSPRDLLSGADANEDEVSYPFLLLYVQTQVLCACLQSLYFSRGRHPILRVICNNGHVHEDYEIDT